MHNLRYYALLLTRSVCEININTSVRWIRLFGNWLLVLIDSGCFLRQHYWMREHANTIIGDWRLE